MATRDSLEGEALADLVLELMEWGHCFAEACHQLGADQEEASAALAEAAEASCRSDPLEMAAARRWIDEKGPGHDRLVVVLMAGLRAGDPGVRERLPYLVDTTVLRGAMEKGLRRAGRPAGEREEWE
ncbi:MAG: hypothetical protein M3R02_01480 [Chloroflexota bacterium]|nr:hypothetical protein [Chloroflexota bacterium]